MQPLRYDPSGAILPGTGLAPDALERLAPRLRQARDQVLADVQLWRSGGSIPPDKQPLDAGFVDLPDRLLDEFRRQGPDSELGRIQATAERVAESVDRIVLLGIGGSYMGARALFEACCHPYHNLRSREARQNRPQLFFEGNNVDNDSTQGLLDLVGRDSVAGAVAARWAIVVVSKSGGTLETAVAFRQFLQALTRSCGGDDAEVARRVVPVTGPESRLRQLADALGCPDTLTIPDGIGGRFSVFTAVGLLPAALLGLDVVGLLEGAAEITRQFRAADVGQNPVLDYTGVCHLMEKDQGATIRVLSAWGKGLEAAAMWYDQLLAESLGKQLQGATPLATVNTRDLHSRGQQHQEGRRDKLITNLILDTVRRQPLAVGRSARDQDQLNDLAEKTLPDIMTAAITGTNRAYAEDRRPTADIHLPQSDEASLGQLLQMFMLATVLEGRLIGINPYGQPGVEAYKKHMTNELKRLPG